MRLSPRTTRVLGLGLGLAGLIGLIAQSTLGQQTDRNAQQAKAEQSRPSAPSIKPPVIATIDLQRVIEKYKRYQESSEQFQAEIMQKQKDLEVLYSEAQSYSEKMNQFKPGTPDYQKMSNKLTEIQAQFEAKRRQIRNEYQIRKSNAMADIYNDVRYIVSWYAKQNDITMVTQAGPNQSISAENPEEIMAAISQNVIYRDDSHDITDQVIAYLNGYYQQIQDRQNGGANNRASSNQNAPQTQKPAANTNGGN